MRAFTIGDRLTLAGVEAWKWAALAFMLLEHVFRYALDAFPFSVFALGRQVFPLFGLALGVALAGQWRSQRITSLIAKLLMWGALAGLARAFVLPLFPLNVLFTFALGIALYHGWRGNFLLKGLMLLGSVACGLYVEFGPWGIWAIALFCAFGESRRPEFLAAGVGCVCIAQGTWLPLLSVPLAVTLELVADGLPRWRGGFYYAYALQWPLIAGVAWLAR